MASSSSIPESTMQDTAQGMSTQQETPAYDIKGRTMLLEEWDLNVQVERPVDFISLAHHGCDIRSYYEAQGLMEYFNMLNGPTYENLVRHFLVKAHVYDKKAAKLEETEKILIDPTLEGKSREEMGLELFEGEKNTRRGVELCYDFLRFSLKLKDTDQKQFKNNFRCDVQNKVTADKNREREKEERHKTTIQVPSTNWK